MNSPSVLKLLIVFAVFITVVLWLGGMAANGDFLWFVPVFDERPQVVCIYRYGSVRALTEGPEFEALVAAINAELPHHSSYYDSMAPTGTSLDGYLDKGYALVAVYAHPVQVHTRQYFPANSKLFFAIDGPYNYLKAAAITFRGYDAQWLPGGLGLSSAARMRAAADAAAATPAPARQDGLSLCNAR